MSDNPKRVCYCIEVFDDNDDEWKVAYIGETFRGDVVRDGEHESLVGGASRVAASVAKHGRANHRVRILDVVNDDADRKALETYLMEKHGTLIHDIKKMRGLLAHANHKFDHVHPDISLDGQPRNFQLNQKRSVADATRIDAAGKAYEARIACGTLSLFTFEQENALFDGVDADLSLHEGVDEPFTRELVARVSTTTDSKQIVFDIDSAFMCAREKRVEYESKTPSDVVDGSQLFRDVKSVRDFVVDDDLKGRMRQLYLAIHPDKQSSMPAGGVAALFKLLEQLAGVVEESALMAKAEADADLKKHLENAKAWRAFMLENGGTKPSDKPTSTTKSLDEKTNEKYLGKQMSNWRSGDGGRYPKQLRRNAYLVVLRDFELFAGLCYGEETRSDKIAEDVNAMLRLGYGTNKEIKEHPHLMHFPAECSACKQITKQYHMWHNYLNGSNEKNEAALLANLPPERVTTAKALHDGNSEALKAKKAESNKKRKEALHAEGIITPLAKKAKKE